jgi:hypothetical protein
MNPFEQDELRQRLDGFAERIETMKQASAAAGDAQSAIREDLKRFFDRHDAIRSLMQDAPREPPLTQARNAFHGLEQSFESWMKSIDRRFNNPVPRNKLTSM